MLLRRLAGLALALLAIYIFWQSWRTGALLVERGQSIGSIVGDPAFLIPGLAALLAALGGLLGAFSIRFAALFAGIGFVLLAFLVVVIVATGADSSLWMPRLPPLIGMLAGFVALVLLPRHKRVETD